MIKSKLPPENVKRIRFLCVGNDRLDYMRKAELVDGEFSPSVVQRLQREYLDWRQREREAAAAYEKLCEHKFWIVRPTIKKQVDQHVSDANRAQQEANTRSDILRELGDEVSLSRSE